MNKKALISAALSVLLLSSCSAAPSENAETEQETITSITEAASETTQVSSETEQTTVTTTEETTVTTTEETAPATTAPDLTSITRSPYMTTDIADYSERFCDWKFDSTAAVSSVEEFYTAGGTKEMLTAAEAAIRNSEIFKGNEDIFKTAVLGDDGGFYYTADIEYHGASGIFTLASKEVDEKGQPLVNFRTAAVSDFDGDGKDEAFILMTIPDITNIFGCTYDCAVYVNSSGEAQYLTYGVEGAIRLICYNGFTHAEINYGCNNSTTFANIYAAENGRARMVCEASIISGKEGLALVECAPQAPGVWHIVWDNVDKTYKKLSPDYVSEELAEKVFASEAMETIREYAGEENADRISSPAALRERLTLYGGKYISLSLEYGTPILTLECTEDGSFISHETLLESDDRQKISADLFAAEEMCAPAPSSPVENAEAAPYTVTEEGIYRSADELISAGGESLLNAAVNAAKESGEYRLISYQTGNAEKNGNTITFPLSPNAQEGEEKDSYTYDSAFFTDDGITPLFSTAAYADFDGDGAKEAFITLRLPYKGTKWYNNEGSNESLIAYFVSSDKTAQQIDLSAYYIEDMSDMSIISYGSESHLLLSGYVYSARNGIPKLEPVTVNKDGSSIIFSNGQFYSTALRKYCYSKYVPLSEDIFNELCDYISPDPVPSGLPEEAWICGGKYIAVNGYFSPKYIYENGSFTTFPMMYCDGLFTNDELYCYEVTL